IRARFEGVPTKDTKGPADGREKRRTPGRRREAASRLRHAACLSLHRAQLLHAGRGTEGVGGAQTADQDPPAHLLQPQQGRLSPHPLPSAHPARLPRKDVVPPQAPPAPPRVPATTPPRGQTRPANGFSPNTAGTQSRKPNRREEPEPWTSRSSTPRPSRA